VQVTFATIDDRELYDNKVRPLLGQSVRLLVQPDGVSLQAASPKEQQDAAAIAVGQKPASKRQPSTSSNKAAAAPWSGESAASRWAGEPLAIELGRKQAGVRPSGLSRLSFHC